MPNLDAPGEPGKRGSNSKRQSGNKRRAEPEPRFHLRTTAVEPSAATLEQILLRLLPSIIARVGCHRCRDWRLSPETASALGVSTCRCPTDQGSST